MINISERDYNPQNLGAHGPQRGQEVDPGQERKVKTRKKENCNLILIKNRRKM